MTLSVKEINALSVKENQSRTVYKDSTNLYLYVTRAGSKSWYFVHKLKGKKKELYLGSYPEFGVKEARDIRDDNRVLLRKGENLKSLHCKESKYSEVEVFPTIRELIDSYCSSKLNNKIWNPKTYDKNLGRFKNHVVPKIGSIRVNDISKKEVVTMFSELSETGLSDTVHRLRQMFRGILRKASSLELIDSVLARDIEDALYSGEVIEKRQKTKSYAALTNLPQIGNFVRDCHNYHGQFLTRKLLELSCHLFMRPSEIRELEWKDVYLEESRIIIQICKGGFDREHIVPLSNQAKRIFLELKSITGDKNYVFYSYSSKYMTISESTVNQAIGRMDPAYKGNMTAHGFRAMITTTIREQLRSYRNDVIEVQLSHLKPGQTRAAYDRAEYIDERERMMQDWSDYLEKLIL